jgi:hypothetical protein
LFGVFGEETPLIDRPKQGWGIMRQPFFYTLAQQIVKLCRFYDTGKRDKIE